MRVLKLIVILVGSAVLFAGCASAKKSKVTSIAVAVTTIDGRSPTQEQTTRILTVLSPEIMRLGFQIARTPVEADMIVTVRFTPDVEGKGGKVAIVGFEPSGRLRGETGVSEGEEMKEVRRRIREMDAWASREMTRTD